MKGDKKGSVGGLDWGSLLNAKALQKLKSLQLDEQAEKLLFADLKDAKLRKAMNDEPELLEGWKELNNVDQVSRVDIQTLKSFGMLRTDRNYFDFFKSLDHSKKTWNNKMNAFEESVIKYWTTKGGFAEFNRMFDEWDRVKCLF